MGTHPRNQPIVPLKRWSRMLAAPQAAATALPMAPRDPVSEQFRRVHIEGDRCPPIVDRRDERAAGARIMRAMVGGAGIGAILIAALIWAILP
jgi:hypothetical protein